MDSGHRPGKIQAAAALRAMLHHAVVLLGRLDALAALEDVVADGLFDIDVFTRLAGPNGNQRMPVVARGDGNGVEFLVVERLPNVLRGLGHGLLPAGDRFCGASHLGCVWIDQIRDLDFFLAGPGGHVISAAAAGAGDADADRVVGADHSARGLGAGDGK
jgi:hypothetical protein